jgi:MFS family permease
VAVILLGAVATFAYFVVPVQGPFFFEESYGFRQSTLGLLFAGLIFAVSAGSVLFPHVRKRVSPRVTYTVTQLILGGGLLLLAATPPLGVMIALLAVGGIALGILTPCHADAIAARVEGKDRTKAMSVYTAVVFLAQFATPFATQPLAETWSITATFVGMGVLLLLSGLASPLLLLYGRPAHKEEPPPTDPDE